MIAHENGISIYQSKTKKESLAFMQNKKTAIWWQEFHYILGGNSISNSKNKISWSLQNRHARGIRNISYSTGRSLFPVVKCISRFIRHSYTFTCTYIYNTLWIYGKKYSFLCFCITPLLPSLLRLLAILLVSIHIKCLEFLNFAPNFIYVVSRIKTLQLVHLL